ncbi:hypothetical protein ACF0H5_019494 [Mactra antiquata]
MNHGKVSTLSPFMVMKRNEVCSCAACDGSLSCCLKYMNICIGMSNQIESNNPRKQKIFFPSARILKPLFVLDDASENGITGD